ncbi:MAG: phage holin family protein [Archangiaceae bacterium]|nr:phage holin family protein [Archangiaceae bacterium]
MALLQALFSFVAKSAGRVLNTIFGWAVIALFGRTSPRQQLLLEGLVAMAALWPVLLVGIVFPKITTMAVAAIPLGDRVPSSAIRIAWLVLAALVPLIVGIVVAAKAPLDAPKEGWPKRLLRGFPITLGLSAAFILMFVTVPVLRIISLVRGRRDEHVPCILQGAEYEQIVQQVDAIVAAAKLDVRRAPPSWWLAGPSRVLRKLGGDALRGFMPTELAYWLGPKLELAFYPSDILVRGVPAQSALAHGLLAEQLARSAGLQTFAPKAQELERQVRNVWRTFDRAPKAHRDSVALRSRLVEMTQELARLEVDYQEWQVLYRQLSQLDRALAGEPQLLEALHSKEEQAMSVEPERPLSATSTQELLGRLMQQSKMLVRAELALAKTELVADLKREAHAAQGLGVAALCALFTVNLLLVALVLGLAYDAQVMPGWAAGLAVAAVVLVIGTGAGAIGWSMRVKRPLERTRKSLKEDVQWAKERMA